MTNKTAVALFMCGLLTFFASMAFLWHARESAAPVPASRPALPVHAAGGAPTSEAGRSAAALRSDAEASRAAIARERRDDAERALQERYQDDARQLQEAQERQREQQLRIRAADLAAAQDQRAARQQQLDQARRIAEEQAADQAAQQRQQASSQTIEQQDRQRHAYGVQRMLDRNWLYWRYWTPGVP